MEYSIVIIMLALIQYQAFGFRTGYSRGKYNIPAPKTFGNETWERINRVHLNTGEQLIPFIPSLLAFSYYVSSKWAILPGVGFLIARQIYSHMYIKNPKARIFPPTFLINIFLIVASMIGAILQLVK